MYIVVRTSMDGERVNYYGPFNEQYGKVWLAVDSLRQNSFDAWEIKPMNVVNLSQLVKIV